MKEWKRVTEWSERKAKKWKERVKEKAETGISVWNGFCWLLRGNDAARRHVGQTTDHFFLFLLLLHSNYHSSKTHVADDWHCVWGSRSTLCLFVSLQPDKFLALMTLLALHRCWNNWSCHCPNKKKSPLRELTIDSLHLSLLSPFFLHLPSYSPYSVLISSKSIFIRQLFMCLLQLLLLRQLLHLLFSPPWPLCSLSIPHIYVRLLTLCLRTEISIVFVCLCKRLHSFLTLMTWLVINGWWQ